MRLPAVPGSAGIHASCEPWWPVIYTGLELVEPGIVGVPRWQPESAADAATPTMARCGMGRKPVPA